MSGNTKCGGAISFKEWRQFVSSRAVQLEEELLTRERNDPKYKELYDASSALYKKINAVLPQELQLALDDYSDIKNGIACLYMDTAYELGMKDAFMLMRKFIL